MENTINLIYNILSRHLYGIRLCPFGSYRLSSNIDDSDLDLLCICPRTYCRESTFETLPEYLKNQEGVSSLLVVKNTYVPVIKFTINNNIEIDLIFAFLTIQNIPNVVSSSFLQNQEEDLRSLQGLLTSEYIIQRVGRNNFEKFSNLLKKIKLWCVENEIYSNPLGLLNGVSLSIMCAKIILLYPNDPNPENKFFEYYSDFDWENNIISIYHGNHQKIKKKLMNVYTPFDIPTNTLYNVDLSQYEKIKKCLKNPHVLYPFFTNNSDIYLMITLVSNEKNIKNDIRFIESKLKVFSIYPVEYHTKCYCITEKRVLFFLKFTNNYNIKKEDISQFIEQQFILKINNLIVNTDFIMYENLPPFVF